MENIPPQPTLTPEVLPQQQAIKKQNSNSLIVILLGIIIFLLLIIGGGTYYFYSSSHQSKLEKNPSTAEQPTVTINATEGITQNKILLEQPAPTQKTFDLLLSIYDPLTKQQKQFTTSDVNFQNPSLAVVLSPNHKLLLVPTNPNPPTPLSAKGTIIIYTLATGTSITITNPQNATQYTGNFVWSPDSTKIAFISGGIGQSEQLYLVNADGTDLHQATNDNDNMKLNPIWSPDGKHIIYAVNTTKENIVDGVQAARSIDASYVREYNVDSKTVLDITPTNPQAKEIMPMGASFNDIHHTVGWIDPDHLVVFYSPKDSYTATSNTGLWSFSLSSGEVKQLVALPITFGSQGILSEDKKVLYTYVVDVNTNKITYYLVHTDGSGTESYTVDKGKSQYPFFSPDGKRLAYQDDLGFWVHDFTTNQNSKIMDLIHDPYTFVGAFWSPDSTQLALRATIVGGAGGAPVTSQTEQDNQGFWLSNADGSSLRKIDSASSPLYWY